MEVKYGILWIKHYDGSKCNNLIRTNEEINEAHKHAQNMNEDKIGMRGAVVMVAEQE